MFCNQLPDRPNKISVSNLSPTTHILNGSHLNLQLFTYIQFKETAFNYFDEHEYQMVSCYQKNITYDKAWKGKNLYLVFEAVAHRADVYINGEHKKCHKNGYNAFSIDVTELLRELAKVLAHK